MDAWLSAPGVTHPVLQAPMAGVSTPAMAAAVNAAGGLGAIALGASDPTQAGKMIAETRARTDRPFNVNLFVHAPPRRDPVVEGASRLWEGRTVTLRAGGAGADSARTLRLFGSLLERDGAWKFLSYSNDL